MFRVSTFNKNHREFTLLLECVVLPEISDCRGKAVHVSATCCSSLVFKQARVQSLTARSGSLSCWEMGPLPHKLKPEGKARLCWSAGSWCSASPQMWNKVERPHAWTLIKSCLLTVGFVIATVKLKRWIGNKNFLKFWFYLEKDNCLCCWRNGLKTVIPSRLHIPNHLLPTMRYLLCWFCFLDAECVLVLLWNTTL